MGLARGVDVARSRNRIAQPGTVAACSRVATVTVTRDADPTPDVDRHAGRVHESRRVRVSELFALIR